MRDIKFRAWDKKYERMTYFDDEDYLYHYPFVLRLEQTFESDSNYDDGNFEYKNITDSVELMQYTELQDKNGTEIYEEDIVEDEDIIGQVIFSVGSFDVKVLKVKTNVGTCEGVQYPLSDYYDECCVIGNIYEDFGLVEKGEQI